MEKDIDRIQFERSGVKVNTTKKQLVSLIDKLVFDDQFRSRFSGAYVKMLKEEGIEIDENTIQKLKTENVGAIVSGMVPPTRNPAVVAVIAAVIVLSTPSPAE